MLQLHATDWFTITGRGKVAAVDRRQIDGCPEPINSEADLPVHIGQHVNIDGGEYEILDIECQRALMHPPFIKPDVGLVVRHIPPYSGQ